MSVYLSPGCLAALMRHVEVNDIDRKMFPASLRTLTRWVKEVGEIAGIKGLHPHKFRHTFAMTVLELTGDLRLAQQLLGHASVQSTERYTKRGPKQLKEELRKIWNCQR